MTQNAIVAEGLKKNYGDVVALDGIDLTVPTGSIFGLLGPNGAGKTTAIRILTTVIRSDGGKAEVLGIDVARHPAQVRARIGLAGQYAALDPNLTGGENLRLIGRLTQMPRSLAAQRADELLERFDLSFAGDRLVKTYSGGMRRRLDLAAALVHRPPVIFLDEPTTGLDPESRQEIWHVIRELVTDGATILLTTQYMEEADRLAEQIAVIDKGKVIALGTPAELKMRLGSTVIDLQFGDADAASRAAGELTDERGIEQVQSDGSTVQINAQDGAHLIIDVLRLLDSRGLAPDTLAVREPSLDDVFLSLTGRHAENKPVDGQAAEAVQSGGRE